MIKMTGSLIYPAAIDSMFGTARHGRFVPGLQQPKGVPHTSATYFLVQHVHRSQYLNSLRRNLFDK
jgi:hypothetical protein